MADYVANVGVNIDDSRLTALEQRLQNLQNTPINISLNINSSNVQSQINQIVNNLKNGLSGSSGGFQNIGQQVARSFNNGFDTTINVQNAKSQIQSLQRTLQSMNFKSSTIDAITQDLNDMSVAVRSVRASLDKTGDIRVTVEGVEKIGDMERAVTVIKDFDAATGQLVNGKKVNIVQQFEDVGKIAQQAERYGNELENLKTKFQAVLNIGDSSTNSFKAMVDSIDFSNITNTSALDAMVEKLKAAETEGQRLNSLMSKKWASNAIEQINKNLNEFPSAINIVEERFKALGALGESFGGATVRDTISQLKTDLASINNIDSPDAKIQAYNQLANTLQQLQKRITEIQTAQRNMFSDVDVSKLGASLTVLENNFKQLGDAGEANVKKVEDLRVALDNLGKSDGTEDQINEFRRISREIDGLTAEYRELSSSSKASTNTLRLQTDKSTLSNQLVAWMENNTKAARKYGKELDDLQTKIKDINTKADLTDAQKQFRNIKSQAASEGNLGKGIIGTLVGNFTKISPLFGAGQAITTSITALKDMYNTVVDLDTALVDLQKTSTATYSQLNEFYNDANEIAKEYGTTTQEIIQSGADWSRLG